MRRSSLFITAIASASAALAQPSFRSLGDLPGGANWSEVWGISADGSTVVGASDVGGSLFVRYYAAFYWNEDSGLNTVYSDPTGGVSARALAVNADGGVITGIVDFGAFSPLGVQAFIWTSSGGTVLIGDVAGGLPQPQASGRGVSADGSRIIGTGNSDNGTEAFFYEVPDGAFAAIGDLPGGLFGSFANGVSADGQVIVGISYSENEQQAFRWTSEKGIQPLGFMPTPSGIQRYSDAAAVSSNGSVIVGSGRSMNGANGMEAFRWTAAGGFEPLGDLPGGSFYSKAYAVSADGARIVGTSMIEGPTGPFGGGNKPRAFIWDAVNGMRDVQELLITQFGLNLEGWELQEARGISADGQTIAGTGRNPLGDTEAWIAVLRGQPCAGDFNHDGTISLSDLTILLAYFGTLDGAGPDQGNMDGDGDVDLNDLTAFLAVFGTACP